MQTRPTSSTEIGNIFRCPLRAGYVLAPLRLHREISVGINRRRRSRLIIGLVMIGLLGTFVVPTAASAKTVRTKRSLTVNNFVLTDSWTPNGVVYFCNFSVQWTVNNLKGTRHRIVELNLVNPEDGSYTNGDIGDVTVADDGITYTFAGTHDNGWGVQSGSTRNVVLELEVPRSRRVQATATWVSNPVTLSCDPPS
jgi:hypothetical protein